MKPPSRVRSLPDRYLNRKTDLKQRRHTKIVCTWKRNEQRNLLMALKKLVKVVGDTGEIDYAFLKKHVPGRSISEIHNVVEALKAKAVSLVTYEVVKQVREDTSLKMPIDLWMDMSSIMAGVLEEPLSTAFSQTFMVSSTEPRTLRNSDPPQIHNTEKQKTNVGGTIPLKPVPPPVTLGQQHGITKATPVLLMRNPLVGKLEIVAASSRSPPESAPPTTSNQAINGQAKLGRNAPITGAKAVSSGMALAKHNVQACNELSTEPAKVSGPPEQQTSLPSTNSSIETGSQLPGGPPSQTFSQTVSGTTSAPNVPCSSLSFSTSSTPAGAIAACFGPSKYARVLGTKCIVDFEKIYRYLSLVEKKNNKCTLTPMESAVVLDLLMSLPEELPLLPCNKLQQHFKQIYSCLSAPAEHKTAMEMYKSKIPNKEAYDEKQKIILDANRVPLRPHPHEDGNKTDSTSQRNVETSAVKSSTECATATAAVGSATVQQGDSQTPPTNSQSSESKNRSRQLENWKEEPVCPLNPFMVPLKLLKRVQE